MTTGEKLKAEGMTAFQQKSWSAAVKKFEEAQTQFAVEENEAEQAEALNNLGVLYKMQGSYAQSVEALEQAIYNPPRNLKMQRLFLSKVRCSEP